MIAAFDEVLRAQVADADVIGAELRHAGERRDIVQVDQRQLQFRASLHQRRVGVPADDAVPLLCCANQRRSVCERASSSRNESQPWCVRS